jgi:hypothetical protein
MSLKNTQNNGVLEPDYEIHNSSSLSGINLEENANDNRNNNREQDSPISEVSSLENKSSNNSLQNKEGFERYPSEEDVKLENNESNTNIQGKTLSEPWASDQKTKPLPKPDMRDDERKVELEGKDKADDHSEIEDGLENKDSPVIGGYDALTPAEVNSTNGNPQEGRIEHRPETSIRSNPDSDVAPEKYKDSSSIKTRVSAEFNPETTSVDVEQNQSLENNQAVDDMEELGTNAENYPHEGKNSDKDVQPETTDNNGLAKDNETTPPTIFHKELQTNSSLIEPGRTVLENGDDAGIALGAVGPNYEADNHSRQNYGNEGEHNSLLEDVPNKSRSADLVNNVGNSQAYGENENISEHKSNVQSDIGKFGNNASSETTDIVQPEHHSGYILKNHKEPEKMADNSQNGVNLQSFPENKVQSNITLKRDLHNKNNINEDNNVPKVIIGDKPKRDTTESETPQFNQKSTLKPAMSLSSENSPDHLIDSDANAGVDNFEGNHIQSDTNSKDEDNTKNKSDPEITTLNVENHMEDGGNKTSSESKTSYPAEKYEGNNDTSKPEKDNNIDHFTESEPRSSEHQIQSENNFNQFGSTVEPHFEDGIQLATNLGDNYLFDEDNKYSNSAERSQKNSEIVDPKINDGDDHFWDSRQSGTDNVGSNPDNTSQEETHRRSDTETIPANHGESKLNSNETYPSKEGDDEDLAQKDVESNYPEESFHHIKENGNETSTTEPKTSHLEEKDVGNNNVPTSEKDNAIDDLNKRGPTFSEHQVYNTDNFQTENNPADFDIEDEPHPRDHIQSESNSKPSIQPAIYSEYSHKYSNSAERSQENDEIVDPKTNDADNHFGNGRQSETDNAGSNSDNMSQEAAYGRNNNEAILTNHRESKLDSDEAHFSKESDNKDMVQTDAETNNPKGILQHTKEELIIVIKNGKRDRE